MQQGFPKPSFTQAGQTAIVTGGSSGIRAGIARVLGAAGANVVVNYSRNSDGWETPEAEADLLRLIPLRRVGETADIAKAVLWLASDESDYVHGTSLVVDGGMTLYPGFAAGG